MCLGKLAAKDNELAGAGPGPGLGVGACKCCVQDRVFGFLHSCDREADRVLGVMLSRFGTHIDPPVISSPVAHKSRSARLTTRSEDKTGRFARPCAPNMRYIARQSRSLLLVGTNEPRTCGRLSASGDSQQRMPAEPAVPDVTAV